MLPQLIVLGSLSSIIAASPLAQAGAPNKCTSVADVVSVLQNNVFGRSHCSSVLSIQDQTATTTVVVTRPTSRTVVLATTGTETSTAPATTVTGSTSVSTGEASTITETPPLITQTAPTPVTVNGYNIEYTTVLKDVFVDGCIQKRAPIPQAYLKAQLQRYHSTKVSSGCVCYMATQPLSTRWITARTTTTPFSTSTSNVAAQVTVTPTSTEIPVSTSTPLTTITEEPKTTVITKTITQGPTYSLATVVTNYVTEPCRANYVQNPSFELIDLNSQGWYEGKTVRAWNSSGSRQTGNGSGPKDGEWNVEIETYGSSGLDTAWISQQINGLPSFNQEYELTFYYWDGYVVGEPGQFCEFVVEFAGEQVEVFRQPPTTKRIGWVKHGPFMIMPRTMNQDLKFTFRCPQQGTRGYILLDRVILRLP